MKYKLKLVWCSSFPFSKIQTTISSSSFGYSTNHFSIFDKTKFFLSYLKMSHSTSAPSSTILDPSLEKDRKKVMSSLSQHGNQGWDSMYKEHTTPWDAGEPAPALINLIQSGRVPNGKALVPGCGRGYDVFALASKDRLAIGCDISPTVIEECQKRQHPNTQFICADFFSPTTFTSTLFDVIYDYTFFCAIPLSLRSTWAERMSQLIRPGGMLITLMFPLNPQLDVKGETQTNLNLESGPPFIVQPEDYRLLLSNQFNLQSLEPCQSFPARQGKEMLGVWIKK